MHRFRAWGLTAAMAAGAGAPAVAANPPTTLFAKWFGPSTPKPAARGTAPATTPAAPAPLPAEVVAGALRAEQDAWERRMSVCLKLRQVAVESNDESLLRQVDDLERQAAAVYTARVAALGLPKVKADPSAALDRRLGTGVAVTPLTVPAAPVAAGDGVRTADASTPVVSPPSGGVRP